MPERVYIGLGSNLDDPLAQLNNAVVALKTISDTAVLGCSPVYRSAPLDYDNQPDFLNAVCELQTGLSATSLHQQLQIIEHQQGRVREGRRYGPRTIDLDLLLYGRQQLNEPDLIVPHPRLHQRAFVLYPLSDLAPDLQIPGHRSLAQLMAGCRDQVLNIIDEGLSAAPQQKGAHKV